MSDRAFKRNLAIMMAVIGVIAAFGPLLATLGRHPVALAEDWVALLAAGDVIELTAQSMAFSIHMDDGALVFERSWTPGSMACLFAVALVLVSSGVILIVLAGDDNGAGFLRGVSGVVALIGVGAVGYATQETRHEVRPGQVESQTVYLGVLSLGVRVLSDPTEVDWRQVRRCTQTDGGQVCTEWLVVAIHNDKTSVDVFDLQYSDGYRAAFDAAQEESADVLVSGVRDFLGLALD